MLDFLMSNEERTFLNIKHLHGLEDHVCLNFESATTAKRLTDSNWRPNLITGSDETMQQNNEGY